MESANRKHWKFELCITWSKKHLYITQKSVPTTKERTIISENKYFLVHISKTCPFNHQINLFLSQQFILLMRSLGFKRTLKVIIDYPAIFLMPGFAFWTFSGIKVDEPCLVCKQTRRIAVSFRMTLVNIILTMCVTSGCIYFCAEKIPVVLILFVLSLVLIFTT